MQTENVDKIIRHKEQLSNLKNNFKIKLTFSKEKLIKRKSKWEMTILTFIKGRIYSKK
jgi:hypothetical protein